MLIKVKFKDQDVYKARFRTLQIVDERAAVKKVNGVLPDEAGAVILAPSDINAASAEDVTKINEALTLKADTATIQNYINEKVAALQPKSITDSGSYFHTDTVEGALQEIGAELAGINTLLGSGIQISFTINIPEESEVNTFSTVSGTTWKEWVGTGRPVSTISGLTLHCFSDDGMVFGDEAGVYALALDGTWVHGNDTITSGAAYTIDHYGG